MLQVWPEWHLDLSELALRNNRLPVHGQLQADKAFFVYIQRCEVSHVVMLSKFLTTLLTTIEDIFELFFPTKDLCLISQELKTSHFFSFWITSSPCSVSKQKPIHSHLCTTSSCIRKPHCSLNSSKEERVHLPSRAPQATQNGDKHKNYQLTEYNLDDQRFLFTGFYILFFCQRKLKCFTYSVAFPILKKLGEQWRSHDRILSPFLSLTQNTHETLCFLAGKIISWMLETWK